MSKVVDERVVSMQFDNKHFEQNVQTSMSTLDKLKRSLNLEGASKGLENVNKTTNNLSFDKVASSVAALEARFSTLGIVGMRVIENITDSMMRLASKTINFLTSGITQGGFTRAMNLENAHFQLQGLLKDESAVSAVMKNVSDSVDGTAYSLDAAAKVASQLAASGMRAGDQMFSSLRGVAGVAAMTNSAYEDIGRIFTQVAGQGRLMGNDLLQLSSRGMNAAATIAESLGKTEAEVREMVSKGQLSFEMFANAMDSAFGEHAKKANETFTGSMANVKSALGRIGAEFVAPLIKQNGPLVVFFNTLRERINDVKANIGPLVDLFVDSAISITNAATEFIKKIDFSSKWDSFIKKVNDAGVSTETFTEKLKDTTITADDLTEVISNLSEEELKGIGYTKEQAEALKKLAEEAEKTGTPLNELINNLDKPSGLTLIIDTFKNLVSGIVSSIKAIGNAWNEIFTDTGTSPIYTIIEAVHTLSTYLVVNDKKADKLKRTFKGLFAIIDIVATIAGGGLRLAIKGLSYVLDAFDLDLLDITASLGDAIVKFRDYIKNTDLFGTAVGNVTDFIITIITKIKEFGNSVKSSFDTSSIKGFVGFLESIFNRISDIVGVVSSKIVDTLGKAFSWISDHVSAGDIFAGLAGGGIYVLVKKLSGLVDKIKGIFSAFDKEDVTSNFSEILGSVHDTLESFTTGIKATTLVSIAIAIGILSASLKTISEIDAGNLAKSLGGIGMMFFMLTTSFKSISKSISRFDSKGIVKSGISLILMAIAINIFADAMKKVAEMDVGQIAKGLVGLGVGLFELSSALRIIGKTKISLKTSVAMIVLAQASKMLADALTKFSGLSWDEIARGLSAMGGALAELVASVGVLGKVGGFGSLLGGTAILIAVQSLDEISENLKKLGSMSWREIEKGLAAMGGALGEFTITLGILSKVGGFGSILGGTGLLIAVQSLDELSDNLKKFGQLSWEKIKKGLSAMGGALGEFTITLGILSKVGGFGSLLGGTGILIAVQSLDEISENLKKLGEMSWDEIGRGLVAMGGALTEIGGVSGLLGKLTGFSGLLGSGAILLAVQSLDEISENLKKIGEMSWDEIGRGLVAMGGALTEVSVVSGVLGNFGGFSGVLGSGAILLAIQGLGDLADALKKFGEMSWDEIGRGLTAMGGALAEVSVVSGVLGNLGGLGGLLGSGSLLLAIQGLSDLADALKKFGEMSWDEIGRGLTAMGGALAETAIGGFLNTLSILGAMSISAMAEPLGILADSVKKWVGITVPAGLGIQLGVLADGVKKFTFGGLGASAISTAAAPLGTLADSVKKWVGITVPESLKGQLEGLADGVKAFSFAFMGGWSISATANPLGTLAESVKKWNGVSIPNDLAIN